MYDVHMGKFSPGWKFGPPNLLILIEECSFEKYGGPIVYVTPWKIFFQQIMR